MTAVGTAAIPALAAGKYARIVNKPHTGRGEETMVELRVYRGDHRDMSWDTYLMITGRHPSGRRCHVNCWSSSRGYEPRVDQDGAWPQWYGNRLAFPFRPSEHPNDDDIHVWFEFSDSERYHSDKIRVALS